MYEYIEGTLKEKNPTHCVIETGGIGYFIQITLTTYTQLESSTVAKLFIHQVVREDAHLLFGFFSRTERDMFRLLLTVSGIGANTARMMLSSLSTEDIRQTILMGNASILQGIKGIGAKTAQRIIIDLGDKIGKDKLTGGDLFPIRDNRLKEEALSALVILGFNKGEADKVISKILVAERSLTLEELIKKALKQL
jgi:holliday junction DNA helicase RuvA